MAYLPWYPLGCGALTRAAGPVGQVAARHGATPAQVALAWLLQRSPVVCPIPGTGSLAHLEENVAAASLRLSADDLVLLRAADRR
jgi:aryl-alcohol dehydrogenase-like predicted oxidoreductase